MIPQIAAIVPDSLASMCAMMRIGGRRDHTKAVAPFLAGAGFATMAEALCMDCGCDDCRPVLSYWSQTYFAALIVPTTVALLCLDRVLPVALDEVEIDLDATGALARLGVTDAGRAWNGRGGRFDTLRYDHLEPFIETVSLRARLPQRLLWANAGAFLDFVVRELLDAGLVMPKARPEAVALIEGSDSPLRAYEGLARKRRVCCLRYRLPGVTACAGICPIDPEAAARACSRPCSLRVRPSAAGADMEAGVGRV